MKKENHFNGISILPQLAEQADLIIFALGLSSGQLLYLNPFFEQVAQQKSEDVMADPASLLTMMHPEDKEYVIEIYQELLNETLERGRAIEFRIQLPDQSVRWLRLISFFYDKKGKEPTVAGVIEDMTGWKEKNLVLNKFTSKKNALLEILSHDLSRPLANIQGLSHFVSKRLKDYEDEHVHKMMEHITKVSEQAIQLIRDFVQQEFLESAQVSLIKNRINIVHELKLVMDEYQNSQQKIHKTFQFFSSSDVIDIEIDDIKFMQVINNLLSNAIKFTPDEGIITVGVEEQEEHVLITVEDNGIGIPAHLQKGLFEKFPKARRPGLKGEPSTGLGMSIIKLIVDWHKGRIWFESQENVGTTFYIELPKH